MKKLLYIIALLLPLLSLGQGAQLEIPYSIKVLNPKPLDAYYYNTSFAPYTNTAQVISQVVLAVRYQGQTFNVNGVEYCFCAGTADGNLAIKYPATVSSVGITDGNNISHSGGPITSSGNITINAVASGGTGQLQYNNGSNVFTASANLYYSSGNLNVVSGGLVSTDGGSNVINLTSTVAFLNNDYSFNGGKVSFDSQAGHAGLNTGSVSGDPSSLGNGDIWYNSSTGRFRGRENGSSVDLRVGGLNPGHIPVGNGVGSDYTDSGLVMNFSTTLTPAPTGTRPGLNFGVIGSDPSTPSNGDVWYNSGTGKFRGRQNGSNIDLVTTSSGGTVTSVGITAGTNISVSGSPVTSSGNMTVNAIPSGSNQQIQFNNSGSFGASANLLWTGNALDVGDPVGNIAVLYASNNPANANFIQGATGNVSTPKGGSWFIYGGVPYATNGSGGDITIGAGSHTGSGADGKVSVSTPLYLSSVSNDDTQTKILVQNSTDGRVQYRNVTSLPSPTSALTDYSPTIQSVTNINSGGLSLVAAKYVDYGSFRAVYAKFTVYPTTTGSWGNVVFRFYLPTSTSEGLVYGVVSGVYVASATTPISGVVDLCSGCSPVSQVVEVTFTSTNPANAYDIDVHLVYVE